jgi:hypothetical protein
LDESQKELVQDPIIQYEYWQNVSTQNTNILEEVFPYFPRNTMKNLSHIGEPYTDAANVEKLEVTAVCTL